MTMRSAIIVPSTDAPVGIIVGTFIVALAVICIYYFTRRK